MTDLRASLGLLLLACSPYNPKPDVEGDTDTDADADTDADTDVDTDTDADITFSGTASLNTFLVLLTDFCESEMTLVLHPADNTVTGEIIGDCESVAPGATMSGEYVGNAVAGQALGNVGLIGGIAGSWEALRDGDTIEGSIDCDDGFSRVWGDFVVTRD